MDILLQESEKEALRRLVLQARDEDFGPGDVTETLFPFALEVAGRFVTREDIVFCGGPALEQVARSYSGEIGVQILKREGDRAGAGEVLAEWSGPVRAIMAAERPALNFMQNLSGIATLTARYVDAVKGTGAEIYDTRKTLPGWRDLAKYAVRAGGARNHRRGLFDSAMIKDNHIAALLGGQDVVSLDSIGPHLDRVRDELGPEGFIEIEVGDLEQFASALQLPVDVIMLDNMSIDDLGSAVEMRRKADLDARIKLEASGSVTLETVAEVAATGVERIAVGAITHSAVAVDIGMDMA